MALKVLWKFQSWPVLAEGFWTLSRFARSGFGGRNEDARCRSPPPPSTSSRCGLEGRSPPRSYFPIAALIRESTGKASDTPIRGQRPDRGTTKDLCSVFVIYVKFSWKATRMQTIGLANYRFRNARHDYPRDPCSLSAGSHREKLCAPPPLSLFLAISFERQNSVDGRGIFPHWPGWKAGQLYMGASHDKKSKKGMRCQSRAPGVFLGPLPRGPSETSKCRETKIARDNFCPLSWRAVIPLTAGSILKEKKMSYHVVEREFARHFKRQLWWGQLSLAHRNRSDFCNLRLRCPSRTPEIALFWETREGGEDWPSPLLAGSPGQRL